MRRKLLGPSLFAAGLATVLAAGAVPASAEPPAAAEDTGAAPANVDPSDLHLTKSADIPELADLDDILATASMAEVIDSANREGSPCDAGANNEVTAFCWNSGDNGTSAWYPQGVTSTSDADASGTYDGQTVLATSWYDSADDGIDKGARISFIDWSDPASPDYRHVLLVEPYTNDNGEADFRPVNIHAGGMFWYGDYLYVADTWNGFRVFDMRHIWHVSTGDETIVGRQADGSYHGFNYAFVLPQRFSYDASTTGGEAEFRHSFTSLDRTSEPHGVVVGEYDNPGDQTRLARWEIDESSGLLTETGDGQATATFAHVVGIRSMQGALSIDGTYYIVRSNGSGGRGDLATWVPGNTAQFFTGAVPIGPEDLSYRGSADELWSLSEYPNQRNVYAVQASAF